MGRRQMKLDDAELDLIREFLSGCDDEAVTLENYSVWLKVQVGAGANLSESLFAEYLVAARSNV